MNIVYYFDVEPFTKRKVDLSYNNYLYNGGFSGTEGPMIETAHYMANRGHDVVFTGCSDEDDECGGNLKYSYDLTEEIIQEADVFIPFFLILQNAPPYDNPQLYGDIEYKHVWEMMAKLKKGSKIIIWVQVHLRVDLLMLLKSFCETNGLELILIHVSEYIKHFQDSKFSEIADKSGLDIKNVVIRNSINKNIFEEPIQFSPEEKSGNHAFLAHYTRGFELAKIVAKTMGANLLQHNYCTEDSIGKTGVKKLYDKCDYFVYPLVNTDGIVHHDTYACVVHEAMACGAIVITWDVACMPSIYGENIILMQPPPCDTYERFAHSGWNGDMYSQIGLDQIIANIKYLDSDKERKEEIRSSARKWALNHTYDQESPKFCSLLEENETNVTRNS